MVSFRNVGASLYFRFELNKAIFDSWITLFEEGFSQEWRMRASETVLVDEMETHNAYINSPIQISAISYRLDTMPGFDRYGDVNDFVKSVVGSIRYG